MMTEVIPAQLRVKSHFSFLVLPMSTVYCALEYLSDIRLRIASIKGSPLAKVGSLALRVLFPWSFTLDNAVIRCMIGQYSDIKYATTDCHLKVAAFARLKLRSMCEIHVSFRHT